MRESDRFQLRNQIASFVDDKELLSRIRVDLADIREACAWYLAATEQAEQGLLTRDELETLFIGIEINLVQHLSLHLKSLERDLPVILEALAEEGDEG